MRIPFDIKFRSQIESGEYKVETRDEEPVEIVLWDWCDGFPFPILGRVSKNGDPFIWTRFGRLNLGNDPEEDTKYDLFLITPEPELSKFEEALKDFVNARNPENPMTDEGARDNATILRALARKELQPEIDAEVEKAYKNADRMQYEKGKEDALKDLPRWRKCGEDTLRTYGDEHFEYRGEGYIVMKHHEILLSDLERLPGINE